MEVKQPTLAEAYHEAGHAVAAVVLGVGLVGVDLVPQEVPGADSGEPARI